ncbi:ImmA/IrrE family metallo-endopeptidase [Caproiciproducens sp. NJN-50]|uniref:helix-turn-helix domain-containing protein n=1 Tax=Acutalibacteraceae TaxID=3082771 RepID=UPI000FFE1F88|nr:MULTISPECIES: XRE family transcriptional regulator [Acutalibacteraceae]QAT49068.1 ImmA/IrrE family metallo-endopeptidase [Caproiciproducens sp. NJN-50]
MSRVMDEPRLIPQRMKEAREYRFLSVTDLADKIGKTKQAVSQYEKGTTKPTPEILSLIANVTGFPIQYFFKEIHPKSAASSEIPLYRGSVSKTKSLKRSYQIAVDWSNDIISFLSKYFILNNVNLPDNVNFDYTCEIDEMVISKIERIAEDIRNSWSLGKGPINDIVGILENNGFIISKIPHKAKEVEAFSLWYEKVPRIFYEGNRDTAVSYSFSICHELGHLILHQDLTEKEAINAILLKSLEKQANIFAGAFLMPAESFGNEYITSSLDSFIALKRKWKVSLSAMIMRANILGIIDEQQKSYLFRQLSSRGYRKHEPYDGEIRFEGPTLIYNSIKTMLENHIINLQDFISTIAIPLNELESICSFPEGFIKSNLVLQRDVPHLKLITN